MNSKDNRGTTKVESKSNVEVKSKSNAEVKSKSNAEVKSKSNAEVKRVVIGWFTADFENQTITTFDYLAGIQDVPKFNKRIYEFGALHETRAAAASGIVVSTDTGEHYRITFTPELMSSKSLDNMFVEYKNGERTDISSIVKYTMSSLSMILDGTVGIQHIDIDTHVIPSMYAIYGDRISFSLTVDTGQINHGGKLISSVIYYGEAEDW